jgi:hypothetical protein
MPALKTIPSMYFLLVVLFATSANAQRGWTVEGSANLEDGGYLPSAVETTCDDYKLGTIKSLFKVYAENAGVNAGLFFIKEYDKPNAWAVDNVLGTYTDGSVILGKKLFASILTTDWKVDDKFIAPKKISALQVLIYHELAHLKQRKENSLLVGKAKELDADFRAGFLMGFVTLAPGQETSAIEIVERFATDGADFILSNGDYAFNDTFHHGTKAQRLTAFLNGFSQATKGMLADLEPGLLEVKADSVSLFESGESRPPPNQRIYATEFEGSHTRRIYFQIPLESKTKDKRVDFTVRYVYVAPDAHKFCGGVFSSFLDKDEPKTPFYGSCFPKSGTWEKGDYKVLLYVNNNKVAESSFTIK